MAPNWDSLKMENLEHSTLVEPIQDSTKTKLEPETLKKPETQNAGSSFWVVVPHLGKMNVLQISYSFYIGTCLVAFW